MPENLRALNLSAFEMVDYVVIDRNEKANKILLNLKQIFMLKALNIFPKAYQLQKLKFLS